ncbi:hypothetical protein ACYZTL_04945 [Pseudomonas sp. LB3P81]
MSQFNALTSGGQSKWSLAAYKHLFKTRVTRTPSLTQQRQVVKTWEIAPGEIAVAPVLQPPDRFVCFFKYLTDRDQQNFGFVVGTPAGSGFTIDPDEVERTLDLFPSSCGEV